ncbi:hypothetical protein BN8_03661 [Fibrisoma limi BUZ 3]|uniref:Uncharacterized protein n=1 Tax=Fibrisoma limi BUZ 3 TaxID=1185876 RepID=I2GKR0_9BACT|nr:hypothetical protein [Fibrisoma limi]CCH54486.1 hypothetical protein BN8_03661 [Fibrisoma limi BUZ 3]
MKPLEQTKGELTVTINGKQYTLKFGMLAAKLVEQHGVGITTNVEIMALTLWAGLMVRHEQNQLPDGFDVATALNWMDDMSDDDLATMLVVSKTAFDRIPNVSSLVEKRLGIVPIGETPKVNLLPDATSNALPSGGKPSSK